jgi:hypothetical protein
MSGLPASAAELMQRRKLTRMCVAKAFDKPLEVIPARATAPFEPTSPSA